MKSKFFRDTQALDAAFERSAPDKVSVCLRLSKAAYDGAVARAQRRGMTTGAYIEALLICQQEDAALDPRPQEPNG